jgi:site-specific DNA-methyltransferase (adenine-specific)/adenine-specific DNA-methyltransferase
MPTLNWIGKEAVVNHHHAVPFHLLKDVPELAAGDPGSGNLIVQGDNLVALKALLPHYAGQVKCIYIDPPYNTGNEGWIYNDNTNSPVMREWLGKTVGKEGETLDRHDRWLCMMYPRLALLRQFLRPDGIIFVNLDDTETALCRILLDEIFGGANFLAVIAWEKRYTRSNNAKMFYSLKDSILVYRRSEAVSFLREPRTAKSDSIYKNPDNDPRGVWTSASYVNPATKAQRPNLVYGITNPFNGKEVNHPTHAWKFEREEHNRHVAENFLWWGKNGDAKYPRLKIFPKTENGGLVPVDIWKHDETGTTDEGGNELKELFGAAIFDNPKPTKLVERVMRLASNPGDLILDSFAGSGTTGHAVLNLNADLTAKNAENTKMENETEHSLRSLSSLRLNPPRRFILVEMEANIARSITAERVRRVALGYTNAKGEKVEGLGGGFRFCELGEPLFDEAGKIRATVRFADLARHVFFTETGEPLVGRVAPRAPSAADKERRARSDVTYLKSPLLGIYEGRAICLLYNGILKDKSVDGGNALTQATLGILRAACAGQPVERLVVYGTSQRLSAARLKRESITFKQIPYSIRIS